jgi:ArsR family transcriptional regulator
MGPLSREKRERVAPAMPAPGEGRVKTKCLNRPSPSSAWRLTFIPYFHIYGIVKKISVIGALSGLAQDTRLDIYRLLVEAGPEGVPAGQIGDRLKLPAPTLSFHLAQLKHAGLVTSRRESRSIIYAANYAAMNGLIAYLTENCCGRGAACAPGCDVTAPTETSRPVRRGRGSP